MENASHGRGKDSRGMSSPTLVSIGLRGENSTTQGKGTPNLVLDHHHFMGLALQEAQRAYSRSEVPVGAVVVARGGEVLGRGCNAPVSQVDPTAHAEILALREAARRLDNHRLVDTVLYVTLEPCPMCLGAILHARVRQLVFGARDPKGGAAGGVVDLTRVNEFNHYVEVVSGIREEECAGLLRQFFRERRKTK